MKALLTYHKYAARKKKVAKEIAWFKWNCEDL